MKKLALGLLVAGVLGGWVSVQAYAAHNANSRDHNVPVCHKGRTIHVSPRAVPAHVRHGDAAGACASATPVATPTVTDPTATATVPAEPTATDTPAAEPTATDTPAGEPTATGTPATEPTATETPGTEPTATETPVGGIGPLSNSNPGNNGNGNGNGRGGNH